MPFSPNGFYSSAILTILQIETAAADPITRYAALFSLICAPTSLLYGCMYIIRFGTMKGTHKAASWATEGKKTKKSIFWSVWVFLAMPAVWLAWSITLYLVCIMAFVWRTGTANAETSSMLSSKSALGPRIGISVVLGLGIIYFTLIINTLRKYGDALDRTWEKIVAGWREHTGYSPHRPSYYSGGDKEYSLRPSMKPSSSYRWRSTAPFQPSVPNTPTPVWGDLSQPIPHIPPPMPPDFSTPAKVLDLRFQREGGYQMPDHLLTRGIGREDWERFISEASRAWDSGVSYQERSRRYQDSPSRPQDNVASVIERWNARFFSLWGTKALLCHEYLPGFPDSPAFAIYLVDWTSPDEMSFRIVDRFPAVPDGLERIDIFDPPTLHRPRSRILGRTSMFTQHPREGRVHFGDSRREALPYPMTRAFYENMRRTHSRSPPMSPYPTYQQDDRMRSSQRSRSPEPSPRDRQPQYSRSPSRPAPPRPHLPPRGPDTTTTGVELHPGSWAQLRGAHDGTTVVIGPSRGRRPRSRSPPIIITTVPPDATRPSTTDISPVPPVVIYPSVISGTRYRSRSLSGVPPLGSSPKNSIRQRHSLDIPYTSSVAHQQRHPIEASGGDRTLDVDPQSYREPAPLVSASGCNGIPQTPQGLNALVGPWTRDIASLYDLTLP